ncbi:hypothetical protein pEaSNUABM8_00086 [Erwinia phage pEa_SNUABM_8]|nr:hypothetical protein pEaSNUABM8_00086 [Erwinia phage pEa_SNUABM_8]QVW54838.1 hypothetical protein pEaSNUABM4_00085 [Erwinia phage pEa_SNUABM_4]
MELDFDKPSVRLSSMTGSWVSIPHPDRIPQIEDDTVLVTATICNPVEHIRSALLPFQELY